MKFLKGAGFTILAVFVLGGGVFTAELLGYKDAAVYLEKQAGAFSDAYHAAKAVSATDVAQ